MRADVAFGRYHRMTNLQLFIAVAIPTLAVLLHFVSTHSGLKRLEERMDQRFDKVDERLSKLEDRVTKLEDRLIKLEVALANLRAELYEKFALRQA